MVALPDTPDRMPKVETRPQSSLCPVIAGSMRFLGAVMILSAVGIWLVPVTAGDGLMVLMKLLVSVFFGCVGSVIIQWGRDSQFDEIHMDVEARELRHLTRFCDGIPRLRASYAFDDLADIRLTDGQLTVLGRNGNVLVQLPADRVENLEAIRAGLLGAPAKTA